MHRLVVFKRSNVVFTRFQVFAKHFDSLSKLIRTIQRRKVGELAAFVEETENGEEPVILGFSLLFMVPKFRMQFEDHLDSEFCWFGVFIVESTSFFPGRVETGDVFPIRMLNNIVSILPEPNKQ